MTPHHQRLAFMMLTAVFFMAWGVIAADMAGDQEYIGENLLSMTANHNNDANPNVDDIIKSLTTGRSKVHLFSVYGWNFHLIVGPAGTSIDVDSCYIFEQDITMMDGNYKSIQLATPTKLKERWPKLTGTYLSMGSFRDADNEYIILVDATGASALDVTKGTITALSLSGQLFKYLQKASLLSANQDRSFFYFESSMLTQVQVVNSTASALYGASRHICSSNQDSVTIKYDPCQQPVKWLKTGLVANETIVLFDSDNSVAVFDTSDYIARTGKPVTLRKTAANKFWTKFELRFTPDPSIPPLFSEPYSMPYYLIILIQIGFLYLGVALYFAYEFYFNPLPPPPAAERQQQRRANRGRRAR